MDRMAESDKCKETGLDLERCNRLLCGVNRAQARLLRGDGLAPALVDLLRSLMEVSGSPYGLIGELEPDDAGRPALLIHAHGGVTPTVGSHERVRLNADETEALFGDILHLRAPLADSSAGTASAWRALPPPHPEIQSLLRLPLLHGDQLLGVVCLANRPEGYAAEAAAWLAPALESAAGMIAADQQWRRGAAQPRERKGLEEQLLQSQKMECVGQLAGGVAHDFSNLLTAILGYTDLTMMELDDPAAALENLEQIRSAGRRASQLTDQLLAFARKKALSQKALSLNELVLNLEKMLRRLIREDIELVILPGDELWSVKADPGLLEQVIINLVVNARQAMPGGGRLRLETQNLRLGERETPPHLEMKPGDYVMLTVEDTGVGMSEEVKAHIFEPFFTTKDRGEGTGLGLATSYGTVRQNEGFITFESEQGVGTSFRIYLPRTQEAGETKPAALGEENPCGSETILLVEDEGAARGFTAKALRKLGYRVLESANGPEALRIVETHAGPLHLLLTDMVMPHMGGREVAAAVRRMRPEIKTLYISGYMVEPMQWAEESKSLADFLPKPFTASMLAHKIRGLLDREA